MVTLQELREQLDRLKRQHETTPLEHDETHDKAMSNQSKNYG